LSMRSKPIRRRIAGGNVIPPRLFNVSVVMLICCNTALRQSSATSLIQQLLLALEL
jgi:hypothetical protein